MLFASLLYLISLGFYILYLFFVCFLVLLECIPQSLPKKENMREKILRLCISKNIFILLSHVIDECRIAAYRILGWKYIFLKSLKIPFHYFWFLLLLFRSPRHFWLCFVGDLFLSVFLCLSLFLSPSLHDGLSLEFCYLEFELKGLDL